VSHRIDDIVVSWLLPMAAFSGAEARVFAVMDDLAFVRERREKQNAGLGGNPSTTAVSRAVAEPRPAQVTRAEQDSAELDEYTFAFPQPSFLDVSVSTVDSSVPSQMTRGDPGGEVRAIPDSNQQREHTQHGHRLSATSSTPSLPLADDTEAARYFMGREYNPQSNDNNSTRGVVDNSASNSGYVGSTYDNVGSQASFRHQQQVDANSRSQMNVNPTPHFSAPTTQVPSAFGKLAQLNSNSSYTASSFYNAGASSAASAHTVNAGFAARRQPTQNTAYNMPQPPPPHQMYRQGSGMSIRQTAQDASVATAELQRQLSFGSLSAVDVMDLHRVTTMTEDNVTLQTQLRELRRDKDALQGENTRLQVELAKMKGDTSALRTAADGSGAQHAQAVQQIKAKDMAYEQLLTDVRSKETQIAQLAAKLRAEQGKVNFKLTRQTASVVASILTR
jgi:hypothetical protein